MPPSGTLKVNRFTDGENLCAEMYKQVQVCFSAALFVARQKSERAKMLFFSVASSCNLFLLQNVFPLAICVLFEIHVWEENNILLDCFSIPGYANT